MAAPEGTTPPAAPREVVEDSLLDVEVCYNIRPSITTLPVSSTCS